MRQFEGNDFPTVGIEQEFHLIDPATGELASCVDDVIEALDDNLKSSTGYELYMAVLEHQSPVCRTIDELVDETIRSRRAYARTCEEVGAKLVASGSHPFSNWRKLPVVPNDHYRWVVEHCVYLARRLLSFGLHVHVGMKSIESAMYAIYEMRRWAYPLQALSANSPYFEGDLTGLASTRAHLFGAMPRTHLPPCFKDFSELEDHYKKLLAAGDVTRPGDLWWMLRPQPPLGTVELRAFDMPTDVRRLGALAAITQAALAMYQDRHFDNAPPSRLNADYIEQNRWKAMRYGLDCKIIEPETGQVVQMREQLERLLEIIEPKAKELHSTKHMEFAAEMLNQGTEAQWQVQTLEQLGGDLKALEKEIAEKTVCKHV
jgi:carboxylate-amine ligase